jgi:hypothetical protein
MPQIRNSAIPTVVLVGESSTLHGIDDAHQV